MSKLEREYEQEYDVLVVTEVRDGVAFKHAATNRRRWLTIKEWELSLSRKITIGSESFAPAFDGEIRVRAAADLDE